MKKSLFIITNLDLKKINKLYVERVHVYGQLGKKFISEGPGEEDTVSYYLHF